MSEKVKPGYKQTEVGVIPEDWEVCRLDSLGASAVPAIKAGPFGSSLTKDTYIRSGYKVYGQEQVIRGDYLFGDYYISPRKYRKLESCAVSPGDVLLTLVGTAGKLLVVPNDAPSGVINPRLVRFSFDKKRVCPHFFKDLFEAGQMQNFLARSAQGGTMGVLNAGMLRPVCIPLPPLLEQRAIAGVLGDVDALITALDQLIAKKRNHKQAAMQQLLTGQTRLPGFHDEWEVKRLDNFAPLQRGFDLTTSQIRKGDYPVVYSNGVQNYHAKFMVNGPGVVTGRSGTIGNVHFVEQDFWPHNTALWVTDFKYNDPKYVFYLLSNIGLERFGTGSGVPTLNRNDVHEFRVSVPSSSAEQTAIAEVLSDIDAELAALEQRRDKTRALKQGMIQELLTGRTRLV